MLIYYNQIPYLKDKKFKAGRILFSNFKYAYANTKQQTQWITNKFPLLI